MLSRIVYGARTALWVGFASALLGATLGALIGVASAYFRRQSDLFCSVWPMLSFPFVFSRVWFRCSAPGISNVIIAITVPMIPRCALVLRSSALALREMPCIEAARALGFGPSHYPAPYVAQCDGALSSHAHRFLGQAILLEARFRFSVSVSPSRSCLGLMLRGAAVDFAERAPWMAIYPGIAISLPSLPSICSAILCANALDTKLRL